MFGTCVANRVDALGSHAGWVLDPEIGVVSDGVFAQRSSVHERRWSSYDATNGEAFVPFFVAQNQDWDLEVCFYALAFLWECSVLPGVCAG